MQRHRFPFFTLCLSLALLVGASAADRQGVKTPDEVLKAVKEKFAPDARLAVCDFSTEKQDAAIVLKGEVDQPAAKDAALKALRDAGFSDIIDKVQVLPDAALGDRTIGIVTVSVAHARTKPSHAAELTTETLMGSRVRLLKRQGSWYYAQTETERYLGWVEPDHIAVVTRAGADIWASSNLVMTTARFALVRERPDADAEPVCDLLVGDVLKSNGRTAGRASPRRNTSRTTPRGSSRVGRRQTPSRRSRSPSWASRTSGEAHPRTASTAQGSSRSSTS